MTPSDVVLSGLSQSELDVLRLDWRAIEDVYPLSPMQQGMLFHALRDGESGIFIGRHDPAKMMGWNGGEWAKLAGFTDREDK